MGVTGTFVIAWSQTEIDGIPNAPLQALEVGAAWSWQGTATRVDGPTSILPLVDPVGGEALKQGAAQMAGRLLGQTAQPINAESAQHTSKRQFVVTDGIHSYSVQILRSQGSGQVLLYFRESFPAAGQDYWVVHHAIDDLSRPDGAPESGGVICFTSGTMIATPQGPRAVETLGPGDLVQTRDSGAQEVLWRGARRMSGARLFAMPELRPIRIHASAFGAGRPDGTLIVSPEHRLLVEGSAARALFNTEEVLVQARHLVNDHTIQRATDLREVTYVHLLLSQHEILWANGIESESFHPATAALGALDTGDLMRLEELLPWVCDDPQAYGAFARRSLSPSEAAILSYETN